MEFLMDYLPAIQFAAALNIGYIIPDLLRKVYDVLNNINVAYANILERLKNEIVIKTNEVNNICVIETKDDKTTQPIIDKILVKIKSLSDGCDEKKDSLKIVIDGFVDCSGYRSLFFYSALYSVFVLLLIPFCYHHPYSWSLRLFFYSFNTLSILYLVGLFLRVIITKRDVSCRDVLGKFMVFFILSVIWAYCNSFISAFIFINKTTEEFLAGLSVGCPLIPGAGCMFFLMLLIVYSIISAKVYSFRTKRQFKKINKVEKKLDEMKDMLEGNITVS